MLSTMAMQDLALLRAEGVSPSDEQVITLNALGLLVERGPSASTVFHAARVAWAGSTSIYEPTIQSEKWYVTYASEWWCGDSLFIALAWACAHAPVAGHFNRWTNEQACRSAIEDWTRRLACTTQQLAAAVSYVITGGESKPTVPQGPAAAPRDSKGCPYTDIVNEALAAGLGLTPERIALMPHRRVVDILRKWTANQVAMSGGSIDFEAGPKTDAYVAYDDYLISIKKGSTPNG